MKDYHTIQIQAGQDSKNWFALKSIGLDFKRQIEDSGGKCIPLFADGKLTLFVQGVPATVIEATLAWHREILKTFGGVVTILHQESPFPIENLPNHPCHPRTIIRKKLTRSFLLSLPIGAFVVSNIYPNGMPAFAEQLGNDFTRPILWNQAVAAGAAGKLCEVVWTQAEFEEASNRAMTMLAARTKQPSVKN
jgi:hypothetical protein